MSSFKDLFTQVHRAVLAAFILSGLSALVWLVLPLYGWQMLDMVVPQFNLSALVTLSAFAVAAIAVAFVLDAGRSAILLRAAIWLDHVPGQLLFENGIRRARDRQDVTGDSEALDVLRQLLLGRFLAPMLDLPWMPIFLIGLLLIHPLIGLVAILSSFAIVAVTLGHSFATHYIHDAVAQAFARRRDFERAFLDHGRMARTLGFARGAAQTWELHNRSFVAGAYRLGKRSLFSNGLAGGFSLLCELGVLAAGAWLLMKGQITFGGMVAALFVNSKLLAVLRDFNAALPEIRKAQRAYNRLRLLRGCSLLPQIEPGCRREDERDHDKKNSDGQARPAGNISLNNVSVSYCGSRDTALREIDLDVVAGECVVIAGPAQSGKSTLAAVIAGALSPSRGRVLLNGEQLARWQQNAQRGPIGYAPDEPVVFDANVHQNIVGFTDASVMAAAHSAMAVNVHEELADLPGGYDCPAGPGGLSLSLRHRKAITLARAVFGSPVVIVLDRPELGLEPNKIKRLARSLGELHRSGATLVIATNEPHLQNLADRVLILERGSIAAIGTPEQVLELDDEFASEAEPWRDGNTALAKYMGEG